MRGHPLMPFTKTLHFFIVSWLNYPHKPEKQAKDSCDDGLLRKTSISKFKNIHSSKNPPIQHIR